MFIKSFTTMTNIFLKIMPATAANIPQKALKGRPDVMHGCNPCTNKPQANHGCNPCNNHSRAPRVAKTLLLALLLALLAPLAARAQNPDCNGPIAIATDAPYTQGFEDGVIPGCWDVYPTTHAPTINNSVSHSGSYSLRFREIGYAVLPEFSNPLDELQISFWSLNTDQLQLGYITAEDDGTCNTFTAIADYTASYDWVQYTNYLLNVPATAHRLAFKAASDFVLVDDVEVAIRTLDCYPLGALGLGRVASNSAYLSWEVYDAEQTAWDVQVATDANFTENVANLVADSHENYLVEGLDPDTYYYVRVKPTCSDDLWSNTVQFWTMPPCDGPITVTANAPYTEGFENPEGTHENELGRLPACWESYTTGSVGPHNATAGSANVHGGSQSLSFNSESGTDTYYAILPEFSNPFNELQISFWLKYSWGLLQLGYITAEDEGNCNTFTAIADFGPASTWTQHTAYLLYVPEAAHRLAFKWSESVMSGFIDDVEVSICTLDCFPVGNLSVEGLSSTTAYLSWELFDDSQTAWNVQLATDAAFTNILADEETDSHENYLLEGLSPGTYYYVRVKPTCNTDLWNVIGFTTLCGPYEITLDAPYTQDFESPEGTLWTGQGPLPPCWEGYNNTVNPAPHNTIGSEGAPNYVHSGAQSLSFYNGGDAYAVLPEFSNSISGLQISFWMRTAGDGSGQLRLGYLTAEDDGTCNTFTEIADYGSNFGSMVQRSTTLENVPATAHRLAFRWSATSKFRCFVDDVTVSINLEMIPPRDIAVGSITPHEADITWKGACDSYSLRYREVPLLFGEGFEKGTMPQGWSIEGDNTDPIKTWRIGVGDYHTSVGDGSIGAHSGHYNALITHGYLDAVTYFVTPAFNLTGQTNLTLSFWYVNRKRGNVTDELAVCYRIGNEGEWNELWSTTVNHEAWTNQTVALTGLANNYQIGFRCTDHCGWGVGLDDITTNINIVPEWTTVSEAESPCTLTGLTPETDYEVQVKSNCEGYEDWSEAVGFTTLEVCPVPFNMAASSVTATGATLAWTGFSDSYNVRYRTAVQDSFSEDFEGEDVIAPGNWTFISKNIVNGIGGNGEHPAGIFAFGDEWAYSPVHGGEKAFRFSSYTWINSGEAFDQYLVSPELSVTGPLKFYHRKYNNATESLQVGYSTTSNDVETEGVFTWTEVALGSSWQECTLALPADVKYVAFHYYGYCSYCVYLDDIIIDDWVPAGEWDSEEGILSGLQPNMPYEWQAQGVCDGEATGWSASAYFTTEEGITLTKDITGYGTGAGGYYLIASPVMEAVTPTAENGFLTNEYDLYRFNPSGQGNEWENHKANGFVLTNGKGYLYASQENTTLIFTGTPYDGSGEIALEYDPADSRKCWNLVGNPFPCEAYLDREYYVLGANGTEINPEAIPSTVPVPPCTAVFVKALSEGDSVVFTRVAP